MSENNVGSETDAPNEEATHGAPPDSEDRSAGRDSSAPKAGPTTEYAAPGHSAPQEATGHEPDEHAGDGHHAHPKDLAHHFDSYQQQFDAGKMGIWLFLLTEVLFFSGLFCAYTIYRAQHPEIFVYAHYHLDTMWGAVNTSVLILSSMTAAWAVRNAQQGQTNKLVFNIVVTILCACTFMGVKYVEYSHKAHDGLLWGKLFQPSHEVYELPVFKQKHPEAAAAALAIQEKYGPKKAHAGEHAPEGGESGHAAPAGAAAQAAPARTASDAPEGNPLDRLTNVEKEPLVLAGYSFDPTVGLKRPGYWGPDGTWHDRAQIFFGIYFFMTGLHGFHVLAGIVVWVWLLGRAVKGEFGKNYFGPIDYAALYWHLVDLIWIYLFPLLYLIH